MSAANDRAVDPALFSETLGHYPTGVAVVTAVTDDGDSVCMVVGTFSSVSLTPADRVHADARLEKLCAAVDRPHVLRERPGIRFRPHTVTL
jgi:Flavin reductase like domain